MGAFKDLTAQFDQVDMKRKGDQFEIVCKWFLENDAGQYKQLLRRVWLWRDWPGRWGIDAGIDLVAEDTEGRLWAIQAKAYENTITRTEVNKFLAEASRDIFAHRMLMATTDKLSPTAQRTMEDLGVTFIGLTELEDFTKWPAKLTALHPVKPSEPLKPHDYQQDAIKDVVRGLKTADRGQLIMACGTGKTLTAWFIRERLAAERTLVLVPSLSLLKQTMKSWRSANPKRHFDALPVCSDETVAQEDDAAISHTSYLGEPANTDPAMIAAFLRKRSGPRVVFATYQSSPQIAKAFTFGRVPAFDLVIADEAHRVAGSMKSEFGTVLDPGAIKAKRRLFMTATPRYYTGRIVRAAKEAEDEIASMDDCAKFGQVFHRLGFGEAIERRLLTDYQVAIIGVDDPTYRDWAERGQLLTLNGKKTDARTLAGQIGLAKAMRKFDLHRVISFHSRVKAAGAFAASMPEVLAWMPARQRPKGRLWSKYASGEMSAGERHVLLQHLKRLDDGERGLLANARCLSEGVDVPALDGVAFIDPRRSEVDVIQAVGRAIRKSTTKTVGTIVIPVFIDTDGDAEVVLDSSVFKPVWDVIKALRAHDDELGRQLDELRRSLGRQTGHPKLPTKIRHDFSPNVSRDFVRAFDVRLIEKSTAPWEFWFGLLEEFVAHNGSARVSNNDSVNGFPIGSWAKNQRQRKRDGLLTKEQHSRLESLSGWSWNPYEDAWQETFLQLQRYVAEHGNALVPQSHKTSDGLGLGVWVGAQRQRYREGHLPIERIQLLEDVHPTWSWEIVDERWDEGLAKLAEFIDSQGHARVAAKFRTADGYRLGAWVNKQRTRYKDGDLPSDRARILEDLGPVWSWDARGSRWEEGFRRLVEYVKAHDSALVPDSYKSPDGFSLGKWLGNQRTQFSKGKVSAEHISRLEKVHPTWSWNTKIGQWQDGFDHLKAFIAGNGHARVPQDYKSDDGYGLGSWIMGQRSKFRKGMLSAEQRRNLESSHRTWSWDVRTDYREDGLDSLEAFVRENGHARVPTRFVAAGGFPLGQWVQRQRAAYREGKLDKSLQRRLEESHPSWSWGPFADKWEEGFAHLCRYVEENHRADVPSGYKTPEGYPLGQWVTAQRQFRRRGQLATERAERLEGFHSSWVWNTRVDRWESSFNQVRAYAEVAGHASPPQKLTIGDFRIGTWVAKQRQHFKTGKLSKERAEQLSALPGWTWEPRSRRHRPTN